MSRELEILKGMSQSNEMLGKADGWHYYCRGEHKIGPIMTHELLELIEKGWATRYEGVTRIFVSVEGIKRLQRARLWPLGPFHHDLHHNSHVSVGSDK